MEVSHTELWEKASERGSKRNRRRVVGTVEIGTEQSPCLRLAGMTTTLLVKVGAQDQPWHTNTIYDIDLVTAHDMGLKIYQTFSDAVVHFGDVPAECITRVVGHNETILCERQSEVAPHDCVTQGNNRRGSISSGAVLIPL